MKKYHSEARLWALAHTQNKQKIAMSSGLPLTTSYVSLHFADAHKQ